MTFPVLQNNLYSIFSSYSADLTVLLLSEIPI